MKWFLVTGRLCGDDEDTSMAYHAVSRDSAVEAYTEDMWEMDKCSAEDRIKAENRGEGVFINGVFESDSEIKVSV